MAATESISAPQLAVLIAFIMEKRKSGPRDLNYSIRRIAFVPPQYRCENIYLSSILGEDGFAFGAADNGMDTWMSL